MPTNDKEGIVRYVDGELDAGELREFETRLQNDPALAAEVALYRELKAALAERLIPDEQAQALQNRLSALNKEYFDAQPVIGNQPGIDAQLGINSQSEIGNQSGIDDQPGISPRPALSVASRESGAKRIPMTRWAAGIAAAAVLVVSTLLLWPSRNNDLYQRLGDTRMIGLTERGEATDTLMQQAARLFNGKEFAKALPLLDQVANADSTNQLALLYRGVAAWHTGSLSAARRDWEKIYSGESLLRYEAAFYLALSYAQEQKKAEAREWLHRIPADAPVYTRAKELETSLK